MNIDKHIPLPSVEEANDSVNDLKAYLKTLREEKGIQLSAYKKVLSAMRKEEAERVIIARPWTWHQEDVDHADLCWALMTRKGVILRSLNVEIPFLKGHMTLVPRNIFMYPEKIVAFFQMYKQKVVEFYPAPDYVTEYYNNRKWEPSWR